MFSASGLAASLPGQAGEGQRRTLLSGACLAAFRPATCSGIVLRATRRFDPVSAVAGLCHSHASLWLRRSGRPVIIGRDPREAPRGIVTTANDAARALGIHSGLSAAIALRMASNALFLPPRHDLYEQYSARVMAVVRGES